MNEMRQLSTHLQRKDRRMGKDPLEPWLEDWGTIQRQAIPELASPMKTTLKVAEELRPEQLQAEIPVLYYRDKEGRLKRRPMWYCRMMYELRMMWRKKTQTSTRVSGSRDPTWHGRSRRMAELHQAIGQLPPHQFGIITIRYEQEWDATTCNKEIGMPLPTYYDRLRKAKKNLRKMLQWL